MLVELCASNYAMYDGFVNGIDDILKISITYCEKTIICIMFQISKIRTLAKKKKNHFNNNIKSKWTPINLSLKI